MQKIRNTFQGVSNIILFNWHFYGLSIVVILTLLLISYQVHLALIISLLQLSSLLILLVTLSSLLTSFYIYDISGLYKFKSILTDNQKLTVINIHAGLDETSLLLQQRFKNSEIVILDFYDPNVHTELSIKRAREKHQPHPATIKIETKKISLEDNSADKIFMIMSAHEIRDKTERILFFKELNRLLKPGGELLIIEHLRDLPNFLAYSIGAFHFHSKPTWLTTFKKSGFLLDSEMKYTPFISSFKLKSIGNTI